MKNTPIIAYKKLLIFAGLLIGSLTSCNPGEEVTQELSLTSPDNNVILHFNIDEEGQATYHIRYRDQEIIAPSSLGLTLEEGGKLGNNLSISNITRSQKDETYPLYAGKSEEARNHYKQVEITLEETASPSRKLKLIFRAFNDGIAFRYTVPNQQNIKNYNLRNEQTRFHLPAQSTIWPLFLNGFRTNYEDSYTQGNPAIIRPDSLVALPLTFKPSENTTAAITEANLTNYAGMYLSGLENDSALIAKLSPSQNNGLVKVQASDNLVTPWRVVMVADNPVALTASHIITNLNDPLKIEDPSWIKSGKVAWDWWSDRTIPENTGFEGGMNNETMEYYIDFAAEFDLEYMLVDASWYGNNNDTTVDITTSIPEIDVPHLVDYANQRDVDIHLWVNWKNLDKQMEAAMDQYQQWGVKGIKVDYMDSDAQEVVKFYHRATQATAEHQLMINFHGAYKPTGIRRTYPNLMTREGVMGLEHAKWSKNVTPRHNVTIPFTRMLAGPMDYTPGGFDNVTPENFVAQRSNPMTMGTRCHQLAMYVIYESPLQMVSDHPGAYRNAKGSEFLKAVPASWDQIHPVAGAIGEYVVIARKNGNKWFLGAMTNENGRELSIPLDFLKEGTTYEAEIFADGEDGGDNPKSVDLSTQEFNGEDNIQIPMADGGGFAAVFRPE